ncbi:MAG: hypothetical protein ACRDKI_03190 [Solirubrobacterales bacterium]
MLLEGADAIVEEVFGELIADGRAKLVREVGEMKSPNHSSGSQAGRELVERWADFSIEPLREDAAPLWFSFNGFGNQVDLAIANSSWDHWEDDSRDLLGFVRDACKAARDGLVLEQETLVDGERVGYLAEFPSAGGRPWEVEVNDFRRGAPETVGHTFHRY